MGQKAKILFVSDDTRLIAPLEQFLTHDKHFVAQSGIEAAYERFHAEKFEILLLDIRNNSTQCLELIKQIISDNPTIPISVITDTSPSQILIDAFEAGANHYATLPLTTEKIDLLIVKSLGIAARNRNKQFKPATINLGQMYLELPSNGRVVPPTVELFRSLLSGFFPRKELLRIALALDEVLRNAYEHGNLGITSSEKTEACNNGTFETLLLEREKIATEQNKLIRINFELNDSLFRVKIKDEGPGYDWKSAQQEANQLRASTNLQGRGAFVIHMVFDSVSYNDSGNEITVEKKIPQ